MTKEVYYRYLGTNGVIESPVHLEDIYYVRLLKLAAAPRCALENVETGAKRAAVLVPEEEADKWVEIHLDGIS
jgi:hypothetical protein